MTGVVGVGQDITEMKDAERQFRDGVYDDAREPGPTEAEPSEAKREKWKVFAAKRGFAEGVKVEATASLDASELGLGEEGRFAAEGI